MEYKCNIELKGNVFDSLNLTSVLDEILDSGSGCEIKEIKIGETQADDSYVRIKITSESQKQLDKLLEILKIYDAMPVQVVTRVVEIKGHIVDSLTLPKVLDIIFNNNARCEVEEIKIGVSKSELSYAKIKIATISHKTMEDILQKIAKHGAVIVE